MRQVVLHRDATIARQVPRSTSEDLQLLRPAVEDLGEGTELPPPVGGIWRALEKKEMEPAKKPKWCELHGESDEVMKK